MNLTDEQVTLLVVALDALIEEDGHAEPNSVNRPPYWQSAVVLRDFLESHLATLDANEV